MAAPSPTEPHRAAPALATRLDRITETLAALGMGAFGWPLAIGLGAWTTIAARPSRAVGNAAASVGSGVFRGAVVLAVLVAAAAYGVARVQERRGHGARVPLYRRALQRVLFVSALPLVVVLHEPLEVHRAWFVFACATLTGALATYSAYHWAGDDDVAPEPRRAWLVGALLVASMAAYSAVTIYLAIVNHLSFNTGRSDLGYYLSVFRQSSEGIPLGCSLCGGGSHVTGHFDPILVPLSPLFLIYPFAETLIVLQTLWLAAGAVPVYLLTKQHTAHRGAAVALSVAYLAYPALHGVNLFDFHSIALCIPLLVWLLYFLEQERATACYVTLGLLLLVREDVSLAASFVGLSCVFSGSPRRVRIGWVMIALSAAYFVVAKVVFMGHADPLNASSLGKGYSQFYEELIPAGRSTGALIGTLVSDPLFALSRIFTEAKVEYLGQLLAPLLCLPLLARGRIQLAYGAAVTLLATAHALFSVHFQYTSTLVPILFGLTAAALGRIRGTAQLPLGVSGRKASRALACGVLVSTLLCSAKFGGLLPNQSFNAGFRPLNRTVSPEALATDAWLRHLARSFPRGAKVAANSRIIPHLGPVHGLYMIDDRRKADFVVVNMKNRDIARLILADEASGTLVQTETRGNLRVYRTKYPVTAKPTDSAAADPEEPGGT